MERCFAWERAKIGTNSSSDAIASGCAGIECLAGIPGTVGGTPVQNVGAYGQEVASVIERVRAFDRESREFVEFTNAECGFAYRRSRFNSTEPGRYIVTRVDYRLAPGGAPTVRYADLQLAIRANREAGSEPGLAEVANAVRRVRRAKGMLLVEGDPDCRSAGSFFKNPAVSKEQFKTIADRSASVPPSFPAGAANEGRVKIPAAWLIEQAGFCEGLCAGRSGSFDKAHAGAGQSRRRDGERDSGAGEQNCCGGRRAVWHSAGDGAGDGGVLRDQGTRKQENKRTKARERESD